MDVCVILGPSGVLRLSSEDSKTLTKADVVQEVRLLKSRIGWRPTLKIAAHWLEIAVAISVAGYAANPLVWIAAILFVGMRQYALLVLLHDAQHGLLHENRRFNDWMGRWLIAAPSGTFLLKTRAFHLAHHLHLGDKHLDPDYPTYCAGPPAVKRSPREVLLYFLKRIAGAKLLALMESAPASKASATSPQKSAPEAVPEIGPVLAAQAVLIGVLWLTLGWWGYWIAWVLPLLVVVVPANDFRLFCEHSLAQAPDDHEDSDELLITFTSHPLERLMVAPNNMNFHAEHHLFPIVPCHHLPRLRVLIARCPELSERITVRPSYVGHLFSYLKAKSQNPSLHAH